MASRNNSNSSSSKSLKLQVFVISLLSFSLCLLIITSTYHCPVIVPHQAPNSSQLSSFSNPVRHRKPQQSLVFDFLAKEFRSRKVNIGLVNMQQEGGEEWGKLGKTKVVEFDKVAKEQKWEDFFPEWIDEEEKWKSPTCPEIPIPSNQGSFDLVVAKVPCGGDAGKKKKGKGIRDLFRLQVNLVVANLVVNSGKKHVYVVFIGECGPMWEIFRCEDLLKHEEMVWIYKPDLKRLEQKVVMPVGSCKLASPAAAGNHHQQGQGKLSQDFSILPNPVQHPKEAYVTVLHSSEAYVCGAIALAQSIIQTNSTKDLILLADRSIGKKSRQALTMAGWKINDIERILSPHAETTAYNKWNYSKLRIWQLTQYDKVIFIDADLVVLENMDDFFKYPQISAVGNDNVIFNSGVMLIEPSDCVFQTLMEKKHTLISYNGGDQGFLNEAFTWWHRWPRRMNFLKSFEGVSDPQHGIPDGLYAIHYLGLKPWMCYRDYDCNWDMLDHHPFASDSAHQKWWGVYDKMSKKLHRYCALTEHMDARIKKWRRRAENASLPYGHWKVKVKDPRQHNCKQHCLVLY